MNEHVDEIAYLIETINQMARLLLREAVGASSLDLAWCLCHDTSFAHAVRLKIPNRAWKTDQIKEIDLLLPSPCGRACILARLFSQPQLTPPDLVKPLRFVVR